MPAPALTHHDILELVAPFARRERHVDLPASDRAARRLRFRPLHVPSPGGPLDETLTLEVGAPAGADGPGADSVLVRRVREPSGLEASVRAEGPDTGALLEAVESLPAAALFDLVDGRPRIARQLDVGRVAAGEPAPPARLRAATIQLPGLVVDFTLPPTRGLPADWRLRPDPDQPRPDLPEDLLAVLGWDWSRLVEKEDGWAARLRLRGGAARRERLAQAALRRAAAHLAEVLGDAPARFHQRHRLARWGVVLRRLIPSITALALIAVALLLPRWVGQERSGLMMALHYVPIAVLALSFTLQEFPRFEIPPWPRARRAPRWQDG